MGFTLASSGDGLLVGAVPLLAVVVNPHPFAVSAVIAADKLPWLLLALPAGQLADRFDRARVAAMANFVRAAAMFAAVALIATDTISLASSSSLVLLNAGGRTIYYSAFQAMVPSLVDSRDLEQANGVLTGTEASAEDMAGPIAGSALFALARVLPFVADVFVYSGLVPAPLGFRSRSAKEEVGTSTGSSEEAGTSSGSMWEGVRLLFADHRLRAAGHHGRLAVGAPRDGERLSSSCWPPRNGVSARAPTASSWPPARWGRRRAASSPTTS